MVGCFYVLRANVDMHGLLYFLPLCGRYGNFGIVRFSKMWSLSCLWLWIRYNFAWHGGSSIMDTISRGMVVQASWEWLFKFYYNSYSKFMRVLEGSSESEEVCV